MSALHPRDLKSVILKYLGHKYDKSQEEEALVAKINFDNAKGVCCSAIRSLVLLEGSGTKVTEALLLALQDPRFQLFQLINSKVPSQKSRNRSHWKFESWGR